MNVIALDIGGSKIKAAVVNSKLFIKRSVRVPTPKNKKDFFNHINTIILSLKNKDVKSIGVSIPGIVDKKGKLIFAGNALKFLVGTNIKNWFSRFKLPVHIENDAQCFTIAESFFGAAKNSDRTLGIIWGTGIGSGYVNGDPSLGSVMELGHIPLTDKNGELSTLEKLASGSYVEKAYKKKTKKSSDMKNIYLSKDGKPFIKEMVNNLGRGLAIAVDMLKPDTIVLGGGVSNLPIIKDVEAVIKKHALPTHSKNLKVKRFGIADDSGLYGAALLALKK